MNYGIQMYSLRDITGQDLDGAFRITDVAHFHLRVHITVGDADESRGDTAPGHLKFCRIGAAGGAVLLAELLCADGFMD